MDPSHPGWFIPDSKRKRGTAQHGGTLLVSEHGYGVSALMHSISSRICTSSPTTSPPLSSVLFQTIPKSLRLSFPSALKPALILPRGSFVVPLKFPLNLISLVTPRSVRSPIAV